MKKSKPKPDLSPFAAEPASNPVPASVRVSLPITSLQEIRDSALRQRFEIGKTIAELDAWRNEIDATIAFLRAQREKN
jgi:hypothetical protein